ncbi:MAG: hypothetical protein E7191_06935 [Erysipelotrichaceae bacterium]|nr:hypothetical protein [Erysipelotrichaceae bacterium]
MIILSVLASSIDALLYGIGLGVSKITVTWKVALLTSLFPFSFALSSLKLGRYVSGSMSEATQEGIAVLIYLVLAVYMYFEQRGREYKEGNWIDLDQDQRINGRESLLLALSLSVDTWIIALPLGMIDVPELFVAFLFGFMNFILLYLGNRISSTMVRKISRSWMSLSWILFILLSLLHSF